MTHEKFFQNINCLKEPSSFKLAPKEQINHLDSEEGLDDEERSVGWDYLLKNRAPQIDNSFFAKSV